MKGLFARGARAAFLACVLFAVRAEAEMTLEVFAGGKHFQATPGNTIPVSPVDIAAGPNGTLTVVDSASGKILSFDPSTSAVTTLPNSPDYPEYRYLGPNAISYGPGVLNLYAGMELWQINLDEGYSQYFGVVNGRGEAYMLAPDGTMYFSRYDDHRIFTRTTSGVVAAVPGAGDTLPGFRGDGTETAAFNNPRGVIFDTAGNMYVADSGNNRVRKRAAGTGIYSTIAGTGAANYNGDNLPAKQVNLNNPTKLAIDASGNLFILESGGAFGAGGGRIRKLNAATGRITNYAGNGTWEGAPGNGGPAVNASFRDVADMEVVNGTLYIAEQFGYRVRKVDASGIITQVMGNGYGAFCGEGVPARQACLSAPSGVALDDAGNLYVADRGNARIRKISATTNLITTIAGGGDSGPDGDGGPALAARFQNGLGDIAVDAARNVYVRDGNRIRRIDAASGIISTIAGAVSSGFAGDGGPASGARFNSPTHIAFDRSGNLYISDQGNNRVRRIDAATGIITTFAGNGTSNGALGDGGPATNASIWQSDELAFDPAGNLLIGDVYHSSIRKVDRNTGVITTIAGNGSYNPGGDGGPALSAGLGFRFVFAVDPAGNIYITSSYEFRRIDAQTGIIDKAPAPIWGLVTPDHMVLEGATDIVLSADNHIYIADARTNNVVFRVNGVPTPGSDITPPVIEPILTGTLGDNGWYRSNVHLTWKITDPESGIIDKVDCLEVDLTYDVNGHDYSCRASSGGGVTQKYIRIKRDATPPTLTFGAINPAPGANGWNSGDASIPFTTGDAMSGVYSTSSGSPLTFSQEGAGLTQQVTVTDSAGNSSTFTSPVVNIDRTAPLITASVTGTAGNAGWYRSDVQVTWTIDDSGSLISSNGCEATLVGEDTTGTTLTCTATSPGGTASRSVTIKRDATPPTLTFGEAMPAADAKGWRMAPVAVNYDTLDVTSGVAASNTPNPLPVTGTGAGVTAEITVFDVAGNSATFTSPPYNVDASAPAISYSISGTLGTNGWYRSGVRLTWQVSEPDSETHLESCEDALVASDTAGITFTCTAASTGGITSQSVTIKRDATPPALAWGAGFPAANGSGWNTTDVSFPFTASDATSGFFQSSRESPVTVLGDGPGLTTQVTVVDNAGNEATFSTPPVNIDRVAPTINYVVNGTPGNNGWYTGDVQVTWQIVKAPESILSTTGCVNSSVTTDTAGSTFSCAVTSGAGTASSSVTIKRDATPPVLSFGTPSPTPNTSGWNKGNVSIPFTRSDALSGLASTSVASPLVISTEGPNVTGQVVVTDNAGNVATFTSVTRNIDKTAPVIDFPTPADGADLGLFQEVFADYSCNDVSLVSCTSTFAEGDYVTKTGGSKSMKVTAKDAAGFTTTSPTHYFWVDTTFNWNTFLAPSAAPPALNLVARGTVVPVRWQLPDNRGGYVKNTASFASATAGSLSCGSAAVVPYAESSGGPAGISYDEATHTFTYNWATDASWTGCRKLTIKLKDNTTHELRFKLQ